MDNIIHLRRKAPRIGLTVRKSRPGPERKLTKRFVDYVTRVYHKPSKSLAVFEEPCLPSGYPDIVLVEYDPKTYNDWTAQRSLIEKNDLKVLHHIHHNGGIDSGELEARLGIGGSRLLKTIEALLDARLIRRFAGGWYALSLGRIFGVRKIVAIEAKITDMQSVINQAWANTWFASESYILTESYNQSFDVLENTGVGIYLLAHRQVERVHRATKHELPQSYAAWMFNEWIGRHMYSQMSL